ncbi:hypothetical protein HPB51_015727 [Rhipicephalus microplus]|uniref:Uncharacterized protein n=1 Tax=Rhipicephalus microplus TaxID=6941 RepID=A0A9J6ETS0_RHIMP|nr:hypothetical protein HPB51_015727 [Rhipicephalus microplus]
MDHCECPKCYITTRVFEMVNLCSDMRADVATEPGAPLALRGKLIDARREIASLQIQVLAVERPRVGDVFGGLVTARAVGPAAVLVERGFQVATSTAATGPPVSGVAGGMSYAAVLGSGATSGIQGSSRKGPSRFQGPAASGAGLRQDYMVFLTPVGSTDDPARDVAMILKWNIDPVAKGIRDVTLRPTRYAITVFSHKKQSLINIKMSLRKIQ